MARAFARTMGLDAQDTKAGDLLCASPLSRDVTIGYPEQHGIPSEPASPEDGSMRCTTTVIVLIAMGLAAILFFASCIHPDFAHWFSETIMFEAFPRRLQNTYALFFGLLNEV
jgi:hypothetical protein